MNYSIDSKEQEAALKLQAALPGIDISNVPVVSLDRGISRKAQAALARQLFKKLGLKGISVTAPNYSMAQSVDVRLPKRADYVFGVNQFVVDNDPARAANTNADRKVRAILLAAFPRHDDRSDSQSDYFDYKWSF